MTSSDKAIIARLTDEVESKICQGYSRLFLIDPIRNAERRPRFNWRIRRKFWLMLDSAKI
jgi:hypothetical protein